jgi:hypothetical protein
MTCLFWFESIEVLRAAEKFQNWPSSDLVPTLNMFARPEGAFKKWVGNVISTTQVTQNVILLALLFIYRLKMLNPTVWGRPGSEYRLLTVALMLGNKCKSCSSYPLHLVDKTMLTLFKKSWTITLIPTRPGQRFHASKCRKFTSWRSSS